MAWQKTGHRNGGGCPFCENVLFWGARRPKVHNALLGLQGTATTQILTHPKKKWTGSRPAQPTQPSLASPPSTQSPSNSAQSSPAQYTLSMPSPASKPCKTCNPSPAEPNPARAAGLATPASQRNKPNATFAQNAQTIKGGGVPPPQSPPSRISIV